VRVVHKMCTAYFAAIIKANAQGQCREKSVMLSTTQGPEFVKPELTSLPKG